MENKNQKQTTQPVKNNKSNWTPKDYYMLEESTFYRERKEQREQLYFYELTK